MATKAQRSRYWTERSGPKKPSYAFEPAEARQSRKSTRKSSGRRRTDRKIQAKRRTALMRNRTPKPRAGR
jgi:hypothetical protein